MAVRRADGATRSATGPRQPDHPLQIETGAPGPGTPPPSPQRTGRGFGFQRSYFRSDELRSESEPEFGSRIAARLRSKA